MSSLAEDFSRLDVESKADWEEKSLNSTKKKTVTSRSILKGKEVCINHSEVAERYYWEHSEILRVAVEGRGLVGYIEIDASTTLSDARSLIISELDDIEKRNSIQDFTFLLPDKVPVSKKQEKKKYAFEFLPMILISFQGVVVNGNLTYRASGDTIKVAVSYREEIYKCWLTVNYTFYQLRVDAAKYWGIEASNCCLTDEDGCGWPDAATISQVSSTGLLEKKHILLVSKNERTPAITGKQSLCSPQSEGGLSHVSLFQFRGNQASYDGRSVGSCEKPSAQNDSLIAPTQVEKKYSQLWRIYTYQCAQGDPSRPTSMDRKRFLSFIRSIGISMSMISNAQVEVIFASNTPGKSRLDFDSFLNSLVDIAVRIYKPSKQNESQAFLQILGVHVFPFAQTWLTELWDKQRSSFSSLEVRKTLTTFINPLREIFNFYAPSVSSNKLDMKADLSLDFKRFLLFAHDFEFLEMGLTNYQMAEIFIASSQAIGFKANLPGSPKRNQGQISPHHEGNMNAEEADFFPSCDQINLRPNLSWDNQVLYFDQFIGSIARVAFVAFRRANDPAKSSNSDSARKLKALFQHLNKTLKRSKVMEILEKRSNISTYPAGLLSGTIQLNKTFLNLWNSEGSPDYAIPEHERNQRNYPSGREVLHEIIEEKGNNFARELCSLSLQGKETGTPMLMSISEQFGCVNEFYPKNEANDALSALLVPPSSPKSHKSYDSLQPAHLSSPSETTGSEYSSILYYDAPTTYTVSISPKKSGVQENSKSLEQESCPINASKQSSATRNDSIIAANECEWKSILRKGGVFLKHGRRGQPHRRFVWCDEKLEKIYWCSLQKRGNIKIRGKSMLTNSLNSVLLGKKVSNNGIRLGTIFNYRSRNSGSNNDTFDTSMQRPYLFTLVGEARALTLEAETNAAREKWVNAFSELSKSQKI